VLSADLLIDARKRFLTTVNSGGGVCLQTNAVHRMEELQKVRSMQKRKRLLELASAYCLNF
jgi:hypothetical protein